jgi:hypothetical protein
MATPPQYFSTSWLADQAAQMTAITLAGSTPCALDPSLQDQTVKNRLAMQEAVYRFWWRKLIAAVIPDIGDPTKLALPPLPPRPAPPPPPAATFPAPSASVVVSP